MKNTILLMLLFPATILVMSCDQELDYSHGESLKVGLDAPNYLNASMNVSLQGVNQVAFSNRNQVIHLGRILFYDKALSAGNTVSCGSCHRQEFAFADPFKHSVGIGSQLSDRNTPSIVNTAFGQGLFWDQRVMSISDLVTRPIANHREMGFANMDALLNKLSALPYYPELFEKAFGSREITEKRLSDALAVFCGKINSFDSDFDLSRTGERELSPHEFRGMQLFIANQCNSCHQVLVDDFNSGHLGFSIGFEYTGAVGFGDVANIGLDPVYVDNGVGAITHIAGDNGLFKIPTLRNVAITPPYMHDGRFATLNEVLDFYSTGIQPHPNLDMRLRTMDGKPLRLNLSATDKNDIIAFLNTLTSKDILSNDLFNNPFK